MARFGSGRFEHPLWIYRLVFGSVLCLMVFQFLLTIYLAEPYPAIVYPGFSTPRYDSGQKNFAFTHLTFDAQFDDGSAPGFWSPVDGGKLFDATPIPWYTSVLARQTASLSPPCILDDRCLSETLERSVKHYQIGPLAFQKDLYTPYRRFEGVSLEKRRRLLAEYQRWLAERVQTLFNRPASQLRIRRVRYTLKQKPDNTLSFPESFDQTLLSENIIPLTVSTTVGNQP